MKEPRVPPLTTRPDVLVLGVGGSLGVAWLRGMLTGLHDATGANFRDCEYFVGTSAGSIVAAGLALGHDLAHSESPPPAPAGLDSDPEPGSGTRAGAWGQALAAPFAAPALRLGAPGAALVRRAALRAPMPTTRRLDDLGRLIDSLGGQFDGRLRIVAVDRRSGHRVVFGAPGAPSARVSEAVLASCAIPWVFAPVRIDGREYVDGGAWSPSNLDVVPTGRDTEVLALLPSAPRGRLASVRGSLTAITLAAARTEALALKARGARVRIVRPDETCSRAMGSNLMNAARSPQVYAAGYRQGQALGGR